MFEYSLLPLHLHLFPYIPRKTTKDCIISKIPFYYTRYILLDTTNYIRVENRKAKLFQT